MVLWRRKTNNKKGPGACVAAILVMVPDWEEGVEGRK